MVDEFTQVVELLESSEVFKTFEKENKGYYLAHGFIQLNKDFSEKSAWQVGYYSKDKDNLAVFETKPLKLLPFEQAFKKDGTITNLKLDDLIPLEKILKKLSLHLQTKYSSYIPNSHMLIVQVINEIPVFNITSITTSFHMINIRMDAKTGEIILDELKSILDLRQGN